jgi:hypothetical protein
MKKYIKISFLSFISFTTFLSCDKEDNTGASTLKLTPDVKGTITLPFEGVKDVRESDNESFTFTVKLDKPQVVDVVIKVKQISGTASKEDKDFEIPEKITIPAYETTATGKVKILKDIITEDEENFVIQIGDNSTANALIPSKTLSFNIKNDLSDNLVLEFNYNKEFSVEGVKYNLCGIRYDIDYYVLDSNLNDTGILDAAATNCIEKLTITPSKLPDGTYFIYYDVFDDAKLSSSFHDPFKVPTTVKYSRVGGINPGEFVQQDTNAPKSIDGNGKKGYVVTIEKNAGVYTLKNDIPEVIASGKMNSKIHQTIMNARKNKKK